MDARLPKESGSRGGYGVGEGAIEDPAQRTGAARGQSGGRSRRHTAQACIGGVVSVNRNCVCIYQLKVFGHVGGHGTHRISYARHRRFLTDMCPARRACACM